MSLQGFRATGAILTKGGVCALHRYTIRAQATARRLFAASPRSVRPVHLILLTLAAALVLAVSERAAEADAIAIVLPTDGLNLRANPGIDQQSLILIPGGTRIAILGAANGDGWYPASYQSQRGWVMGAFLAFDELAAGAARKATVNAADGLNVRAAPSQAAVVVTVLAAGMTVTATGQATSDGWALVQVAELSGWVNAAYLTYEGAPSLPTTGTATAARGVAAVVVRYYHSSFEGSGMACGGVYHADDPTIAATNSWPCGTALRVCNGPACIAVTVKDTGGMAPNEIDLSAAGFARLASLGTGTIAATAEVVSP